MEKLERLCTQEDNAAAELRTELMKEFPVGTEVSFMIRHGQINPSTGVVISYRSHGYLAVSHNEAKKYSRYSVRDVHFAKAVKI